MLGLKFTKCEEFSLIIKPWSGQRRMRARITFLSENMSHSPDVGPTCTLGNTVQYTAGSRGEVPTNTRPSPNVVLMLATVFDGGQH